jgi:hypothetical protein
MVAEDVVAIVMEAMMVLEDLLCTRMMTMQ